MKDSPAIVKAKALLEPLAAISHAVERISPTS